MRISVITAVYNSGSTIAEAIRSVKEQDYPDLEYVIVDGRSTDDTMAVVGRETLEFPHRLRILSEPDRGMYDAMRKGIELATGDYVGILNADDRFEGPSVISAVAEAAESTDAVIGDVVMCRTDSWDRIVRYYSASKFTPSQLLQGIMPPHAGFYAHRRLFAELGSYRPDYRLAGDFELMIRFFLKYPLRFKHIPVVVVRMRVGGASNRNVSSRLRLNSEVLRALREHGYPSSWFLLLAKIPGKVMQFFRRPPR